MSLETLVIIYRITDIAAILAWRIEERVRVREFEAAEDAEETRDLARWK